MRASLRIWGERKTNKHAMFIVPVPDRSAKTLVAIIKEHIAVGSIIYSDCWKAYDRLEEEGYKHLKVNHPVAFVDPKTGCHTNSIEGEWQKIKYSVVMPKMRNVREGLLAGYLAVYMWRRGLADDADIFMNFFNDMSKQVYTGTCDKEGCAHCRN